jgi:hypothetical protein
MKSLKSVNILPVLSAFKTLTIIFLLNSLCSYSQPAGNFAGNWKLNLSKSTIGGGPEILSSSMVVTQKDNEITFNITLVPKNSNEINRTEKYLIGGSISVGGKSEVKSTTLTTAWSRDKQAFTTTEIIVYNTDGTQKEFREIKTYSLTNGGKTLIIKADDEEPAGSQTPENAKHTVRVYDKTL